MEQNAVIKNKMNDEYQQEKPFTILIEPTEGCNLGCWFCGLRGMRQKGTTPYFHMKIETAERIASEIKRVNWNSKIVFAQHGEPTLNPDIVEIIKVFRKYLPNNIFHMYSNGWGYNRAKNADEYLTIMLDAGLDNLIIDCYSTNGDWNFINRLNEHNKALVVPYEGKIPLYTHNRKKRILLLPPIATDENHTMTRNLSNHAGAAAPLDRSFNNKRCAMPFREMAFRYTGMVDLCCDDFRGEYPIGDIYKENIDSLWNSVYYQAARIMLYNNDRNFRPCDGCTNRSVRVGLLPDHAGQKSLPPITPEIRRIAVDNHRRGPMSSIIVKRKWEQK